MNMIIKVAMAFVCVWCFFLSAVAQSDQKENANVNVVMTLLSVNDKTVSFELHNQGNTTRKFETFGVKRKLIKLRFPVYENLEDGKWQKIKIGYCATGRGLNLLELPAGGKQNVIIDIDILKNLIIFPATIRVKICDEVSSKYITSNEFIIKEL